MRHRGASAAVGWRLSRASSLDGPDETRRARCSPLSRDDADSDDEDIVDANRTWCRVTSITGGVPGGGFSAGNVVLTVDPPETRASRRS